MKTVHSFETVRKFLEHRMNAKPSSVHNLSEGHSAQAFWFENMRGDKLVLRIAPQINDFLCDSYAYQTLGTRIPIPRVHEIAAFDAVSYFCISDFIVDEPSNALDQKTIESAQKEILRVRGALFTTDISTTSGFGPIEVTTGNGKFATWREAIEDELTFFKPDSFRLHANNIGLDLQLIDTLMHQARANFPFASSQRRLLHNDFGFDNMLIHDARVTAILDWAQIGYGDWMYDYAKSDFWWPGRHDDKHKFAAEHSLDNENLNQREALYWAVTALGTVRFADKFQNEEVSQWLHKYLPDKIRPNAME